MDHVQAAAGLTDAQVHNYAIGGAALCDTAYATASFDQLVSYTWHEVETFTGQEKTVALVMLGESTFVPLQGCVC